jgi:hypothetical protein
MRGRLMLGAASAALLALALAAPAAAQDGDQPGDAATQATLTVGQSVSGAVDPAGDTDWYRLSVQQGQRYTITLEAASAESETAVDTLLSVYTAAGEQVAQNDDAGGTLNSRLSYAPQASGDVFVEARAFADSGVGAYTLNVEASVIPPDDAAGDATTSARVTPGRALTGVIEYEGDTDWYRLNARSGYSYRITLVTAEGREDGLADPLLQVFDAEGAQLAYNDDDDGLNSGLDFVPQRSGPVFVAAAGFSDAHAGAYTLNIAAARLPSDPATGDAYTRARITVGGQTVSGAIDYVGDRDWHRVRLNEGETYRFALNSNGGDPLSDPYLRLYDQRGDEVAMDDDGGGDLNALLEFTAPATGTYFVEASGFGDGATGGYALRALEGDIAADASTDMRLSAEGDYREGVLAPAGDRDWYRLDLTEGQAVRIALNSAAQDGLDTMVVLYGTDSQEVARDDDGGDGLNSWLEYQATAAGTYYLEARGFTDDAQGAYSIMVAPGEISDNSDSNETLTPNGDSRISTIGAAGDVDWFVIEMIEGRPYRFNVEGAGETPLGDPVLTLYNATGEQVATDDDGGAGVNAYLSYASPTGGPHFVAVSGFGESTGGYAVRGVDTDVPGHIYTDEALDAVNGDERASRIDLPGDLDYFRVELEAGRRYVMEARAVGPNPLGNPVLTLMDGENNRVASDNDSGPGRNALLRFTAREAGSYYIQASGLGGSTGSYQVSIVRQ